MSFLRRLIGSGDTQKVNVNVTYFKRIRDGATLDVVGEAYRQEQVRAARPPGPNDLPPGLPAPPEGYYKAMLVPEPTNQYDKNAIRAALWSGDSWSLAGYLSRSDAVRYQPLFRWLATNSPTGPAIACDAALTWERGGTGVVLHLGTPGECIVELVTDDLPPVDPGWTGKSIVFTGEGATTIHGVSLDRAAQAMLAKWAGCDVLPRVTKKVDLLVVADPDQATANVHRARDYQVPTSTEAEFLAGMGIPLDAIGRVSGRWAVR